MKSEFLKKFFVCQWAIFLELYFCEYVVSIAEYPRNLKNENKEAPENKLFM